MTEQEFKILFDKYSASLIGFAINIIHDTCDAQDIVSGVFVNVWQKQPDTSTSMNQYLHISVTRACYDYLRHRKQVTKHHGLIKEQLSDWEDYTEAKMIKYELLRLIMGKVQSLPPIRKTIFLMLFNDGLTVKEVAQRLRITVDSVRVQKARAINYLKLKILNSV
jgi:RNA polymerase sigma-70 factor (ECF subfamily)